MTNVVSTPVRFQATAQAVWEQMLSYEEVPDRPALLLRALLPNPVRTEGDKTSVGTNVLCTYRSGELVKRILVVEPPHLLRFEVMDQHIGIEDCVTLGGGSYQIRACGEQTEIVLTTNYRGHLRPRSLWRPLERFLGHQFHHHILDGMRAAMPCAGASTSKTTCTTTSGSPSPH